MTVAEIIEQAKTLTPLERDELVNRLLAMQYGDSPDELPPDDDEQSIHWGKSLNQLMDTMDPIEMKYPEIDDPVEWVKHLRSGYSKDNQ